MVKYNSVPYLKEEKSSQNKKISKESFKANGQNLKVTLITLISPLGLRERFLNGAKKDIYIYI